MQTKLAAVLAVLLLLQLSSLATAIYPSDKLYPDALLESPSLPVEEAERSFPSCTNSSECPLQNSINFTIGASYLPKSCTVVQKNVRCSWRNQFETAYVHSNSAFRSTRFAYYQFSGVKNLHVRYDCSAGYRGLVFAQIEHVHTYKDLQNQECSIPKHTKIYKSTVDYLDSPQTVVDAIQSTIGKIILRRHLNLFKCTSTKINEISSLQLVAKKQGGLLLHNCTVEKTVSLKIYEGVSRIENSTINQVDSMAMTFMSPITIKGAYFGRVMEHGLIVTSEMFDMSNTVFDHVGKYGIWQDSSSTSIFTNVTIRHCEIPCVVVRNATFENFHIEGENVDDLRSKYVMNYVGAQPYTIGRRNLSATDDSCQEREKRMLFCNTSLQLDSFELLPEHQTRYDFLNISNANELTVFYDCGKRYRLTNVTASIVPKDLKPLVNCSKEIVFEVYNSFFRYMQLKSFTRIIGEKNLFNVITVSAPVDLSGLKMSTINILSNLTLGEDQQWTDLTIKEFDDSTIDSRLIIGPRSEIFSINNIHVLASFNLVNSSIWNVDGLKAMDGSSFSLVNSTIIVIKREGIFIADEANFHCQSSVLPHQIFKNELQNIYSGLINVGSYDQITGNCKWFQTSLQWMPEAVIKRSVLNFQRPSSLVTLSVKDPAYCDEFLRENRIVCNFQDFFNGDVALYIPEEQENSVFHPHSEPMTEIEVKNVDYLVLPGGVPDKIILKNVKKVEVQKIVDSDEETALDISLKNSASKGFSTAMQRLSLDSSSVESLQLPSIFTISVLDSKIEKLNAIIFDKATFENSSIGKIDKLGILGNVTFSNCRIETILQLAIYIHSGSHLQFENVSIGRLDRESFAVHGVLSMRNVTIDFAADKSIVFGDNYYDSQFSNVTIQDGGDEPFLDAKSLTFSFSNVEMLGHVAVKSKLIESLPDEMSTSPTFPTTTDVFSEDSHNSIENDATNVTSESVQYNVEASYNFTENHFQTYGGLTFDKLSVEEPTHITVPIKIPPKELEVKPRPYLPPAVEFAMEMLAGFFAFIALVAITFFILRWCGYCIKIKAKEQVSPSPDIFMLPNHRETIEMESVDLTLPVEELNASASDSSPSEAVNQTVHSFNYQRFQ